MHENATYCVFMAGYEDTLAIVDRLWNNSLSVEGY